MRTMLLRLPIGCKGYIIRDPYTDEETVVLNSRYTYEANIETYHHEAAHHCGGDFRSNVDADKIEFARHKRMKY